MNEHLEDLIVDQMDDASRLALSELKGHDWFHPDQGVQVDWELLEKGIRQLVWRTAVHVMVEIMKRDPK